MMASTAGFPSATDIGTRYAHPRTRLLWVAAAVVGACYGIFLILTALRLPTGAELTGQFALQPAVKALTAVPLGGAAAAVASTVAGAGGVVFWVVRRDDRHRKFRPRSGGVGRADLVGLRHITGAHHGGFVLRPRVCAVCYIF